MDNDFVELPHSPEIEKALVGACIYSIVFYRSITEEGVTQDDFHVQRIRDIWISIKTVADKGIQPDSVSILDEMERSRSDSGVDYAYLQSCATRGADANWDAVKDLCARLKDYSLRRRIVSATRAMLQGAYDYEIPAEIIYYQSFSNIQKMGESSISNKHEVNVGDIADDYEARVIASITNGVPPGLLTGLEGIDSLLKGLKPGRSYIVGGRPGNGKTSLLLSIIAFLETRKDKTPIVLNSMEMTNDSILGRLAAMIGEISGGKIENPATMTAEDEQAFRWAMQNIKKWPLKIICERDPNALYSRIARMTASGKCALLMNDYIGKFEAKAENRVRQVGVASAMQSKISIDFKIPVLTAAQVSRAIDQRGPDSELVLSDLKESGDIEQDADVVIFINPDKDTDTIKHVNVAKNRFGSVGRTDLSFRKDITRFFTCKQRVITLERDRDIENYND